MVYLSRRQVALNQRPESSIVAALEATALGRAAAHQHSRHYVHLVHAHQGGVCIGINACEPDAARCKLVRQAAELGRKHLARCAPFGGKAQDGDVRIIEQTNQLRLGLEWHHEAQCVALLLLLQLAQSLLQRRRVGAAVERG